jgi:hypothetical protein
MIARGQTAEPRGTAGVRNRLIDTFPHIQLTETSKDPGTITAAWPAAARRPEEQ